ncbi:MAG: DUF6134 family protein [Puniceicoccaceae bacterium]
MKLLYFSLSSLAVLLLSGSATIAQTSFDAVDGSLEWRFKVFLDDKEIGWHEFRVDPQGSRIKVETEARFDVKFFFITAFRYQHRNVEAWDSTGLVSIDAYTNANGDEFIVQGERAGEHFRLNTGQTDTKLPAELKSFCYWSPEILKADQLLNSQTGEYEPVAIIERGESTIAYQGESIPARQYDIMVKGLPVSIWYAVEDQRWLALESLTEGGRTLRYEPVVLPARSVVNQNLLTLLD